MADKDHHARKFMLVGPDRVFYSGLHGRPRKRVLGGLGLFAARNGQVSIFGAGGLVSKGQAGVISPYFEHSLECDLPHLAGIIIEPESVDAVALAQFEARCRAMAPDALADMIFAAGDRLSTSACPTQMSGARFDEIAFGAPLPRRNIDPRVARALDRLRADPGNSFGAVEGAAIANLSLSRFLHLFKQETGVPLKVLRAWKRARHLLNFANTRMNLTHLAQDIGYPNSTHFSHSIRRFYGLKPRTIFAGSRDMEIFRAVQ